MLTQRSRGLAHSFLLVQATVLSLIYWLSVALILFSTDARNIPDGWSGAYVRYHLALLAGLLFESLGPVRASGAPLLHWAPQNFWTLQGRAFRQTTFALTTLLVYLALTKDTAISRAFLIGLAPLLHLGLSATYWRIPALLSNLLLNRHPQTTLLLGSGPHLPRVAHWLLQRSHLGIATIGYLSDHPAPDAPDTLPRLGSPSALPDLLASRRIQQILYLESPERLKETRQIVDLCENSGVRLLILGHLDNSLPYTLTHFQADGLNLITLRPEPLQNPVNLAIKRLLDILVASAVLLLVLPPLALLVHLLHRRQSPGPLFYRQSRTGIHHRPFRLLKFRTMHAGPHPQALQATTTDPRIFPAGRWLRRYSLDEIPQFWNVLTGAMSVVGPRPHMPEHDAWFAQYSKSYGVRHFVKPGITGLAQVRGLRGEIHSPADIERRLESDIFYLENWSLPLDLSIILRTALQILRPPPSAY